jgi:hypothetical protein
MTNYYLLIFDTDAEKLLDIKEYAADYDRASDEYAQWEEEARKKGRNLEVVLLGAESLDVIRRTHSNYFDAEKGAEGTTAAQFQRLLDSVRQ